MAENMAKLCGPCLYLRACALRIRKCSKNKCKQKQTECENRTKKYVQNKNTTQKKENTKLGNYKGKLASAKPPSPQILTPRQGTNPAPAF